ncbi:NAC domain containing protein 53 [Euphorbia peplus]|nr:NAC domain containing protein 53 [Euphorbia peplus]
MALSNIATGYRFLPTDKELLYLLFMKLTSRSLSPADALLVPESNLYGKQEPWQLFDEFGSKYIPFYGSHDLFFFSKLNKKTKNSMKIEKRVGVTGSNWHGKDKGKNIVAEVQTDDKCLQIQGLKKRFKYNNKNSSQHCGWIMYEFSLPELNGEIVLCRLRKNEDTVPRPGPSARATCEAGEADPPIEKRKTELKNVKNTESAKVKTQSNCDIIPCQLRKDEVVVARATCKGEDCILRKNEDVILSANCKGEASTKRQKLKPENSDFNNARSPGTMEFNNNDDSPKSITEVNRAGGENPTVEVRDNNTHDLDAFVTSTFA